MLLVSSLLLGSRSQVTAFSLFCSCLCSHAALPTCSSSNSLSHSCSLGSSRWSMGLCEVARGREEAVTREWTLKNAILIVLCLQQIVPRLFPSKVDSGGVKPTALADGAQ